jgi:hypothetical protein
MKTIMGLIAVPNPSARLKCLVDGAERISPPSDYKPVTITPVDPDRLP